MVQAIRAFPGTAPVRELTRRGGPAAGTMEDLWLTLLLASGLTLGNSRLQDRLGLALSDEGYLWDGVLRTAAGERPVVDFKAYDPGRYHWCALGSHLLGPGLVALRRSTALFQLLGLWAGLLVLRRVVDSAWLLAAIGLLMLWWMQPRWKRFEHSISIFAVVGAFLLLEDPVAWRSFLAGVFVGMAAIMGRNHGLYSLAAFGCVHLSLLGRVALPDLGGLAVSWAAGIVAGYSPMLWTWVRDREAFRAYLHGMVLVVFRRRATNLGRPVPWPWRVPRGERSTPEGLSWYLSGFHFLFLPLYHLGVLAWSPWAPATPSGRLAVAASMVGVFYLHHAFSRADPSHLCQVMQPFLIGSVALCTVALRDAHTAVLVLVLAVLAYFTARLQVPAWRAFVSGVPYTEYVSRGERLRIPVRDAAHIDALRSFVDETLDPDETLFVAPVLPGLYPTLGRHSPALDTYPIFPATEEGQTRILADLEAAGVRCALLVDCALDGREELRYRNTHPRVWQFVEREFESVAVPGLPEGHQIYLRHMSGKASVLEPVADSR